VRVVSSAMHGFYQTGRTQMALYLLAGVVLLLAFAR
jgi:hypothetical protein